MSDLRGLSSTFDLSTSGRWLAYPVNPKGKMVFDLEANPITMTLLADAPTTTSRMTISPDERFIAVTGEPHLVVVYEISTWERHMTLKGHTSGAKSVAFSNDSRRLITAGGGDEALKLWDIDNQRELLALEGEGSFWTPTLMSPDGKHIGSLSDTGKLHIWSAPSFQEIDAMESKMQ